MNSLHTQDRSGSAVVTLPSDREIRIVRTFNAPAHLVFKAWTTPEYVRRWWGNDDAPLSVCDIDLTVGGAWRYVMQLPDGGQHGWHGQYREIAGPGLLVSTEVYEGFPDAESVDTMHLVETDGCTEMTVNVLHSTKENRDGHINSGMEAGMQQVMNQLDVVLVALVVGEVRATATVTPFLWFDTDLREPLDFYRSIFPNFTSDMPAEGPVMMANFVLNGQRFMALNGGPHFRFNEAISIFVSVETQDEVDDLWEKLGADGGEGQCGWMKDRFGLWWQVVPTVLGRLLGSPDRPRADNAMQAMMQMTKLSIADLQAAYDS